MTKIKVYLRDEELKTLLEVARRSERSVADLIRHAIQQTWLRPKTVGPVALWDGEPGATSVDHDRIYGQR